MVSQTIDKLAITSTSSLINSAFPLTISYNLYNKHLNPSSPSQLDSFWPLLPVLTLLFYRVFVMSTTNSKYLINHVFDVAGKVALVTGGGSGIGLMATQALAVNGAKVYIVGRTEEKLSAVVQSHGHDIAGEIIPITADITQKSEIARLVKEIESKEDCLCVLINNAGISGQKQEASAETAEEMRKNLFDDEGSTFDDWCNTYRTNVPQLFFMTMAFLPLLQKATNRNQGYSGTVINITSISGIVKKSQNHFGYNASKAAAIHLTKMLASEVAENRLKVRINSIAPGVFPSEMTACVSGSDQKSHIEKEKYEKVPARRPGRDEDMGGAILFAVTNQYLNGVTIAVDGGYILHAGA
ncbi:Short-chain dehydrogenase/reductase VdtF [Erysiphe necator]|nr:Short-chain dehydrogenase/reductase VdtF [Erysiphe necator]